MDKKEQVRNFEDIRLEVRRSNLEYDGVKDARDIYLLGKEGELLALATAVVFNGQYVDRIGSDRKESLKWRVPWSSEFKAYVRACAKLNKNKTKIDFDSVTKVPYIGYYLLGEKLIPDVDGNKECAIEYKNCIKAFRPITEDEKKIFLRLQARRKRREDFKKNLLTLVKSDGHILPDKEYKPKKEGHVLAHEWNYFYDSQGWHKGVWHGSVLAHCGYSLHISKEAAGDHLKQDKKNEKIRERLELGCSTEDEKFIEKHKLHSLFKDGYHTHTPPDLIQVTPDVFKVVQKSGKGIVITEYNKSKIKKKAYYLTMAQMGRHSDENKN